MSSGAEVESAAFRLDVHIDDSSRAAILDEVRAGLTRTPKRLSPKFFYDARGSELFDQITEQPEYYPTRSERAILNRVSPEIIDRSNATELVELGSGTASKTRALLYAMAGAGTLRRYVPVDVDVSVVEASARELAVLYPGLSVHGVVADFGRHLELLPGGRSRLFAFLGGTVGNLHPGERADFLAGLRGIMGPTDRLLLGTDLVKDPAMLEAAYNDAAGVTAAFNRNMLRNLNTILDGDADPDAFVHVAEWSASRSRIEIGLRATGRQRIRFAGGELEVDFEPGETLETEISTKFLPAGVEAELVAAGFALDQLWTDPESLFAVSLARPR